METALVLLALVSAIMETTAVWQKERDHKAATAAGQRAYDGALKDPKTAQRALTIIKIVPADTLRLLVASIQECYDKYNRMHRERDKYFPEDFDKAEEQLRLCLCRELSRLKKVAGSLPDDDLEEAWRRYECA